MRTSIVAALWLSFTLNLLAQNSGTAPATGQDQGSTTRNDTPFAVVHNEANSRRWERTIYQQLPDGTQVPLVNRYEEVATGLNFKNPDTGEWEESREVIDLVEGGAAARHGQHKVNFAADLATFGAIDMEMPDGKHLQSHMLGLGYFDRSSGQSVFIAEVTNSVGQLVSSNQVWYDNAFSGLKAGVRYTYTRDSFEQDVILEEQPPAPEVYGLNSATTVLQAFTEFVSPPTPVTITSVDASGTQLPDTSLSFGCMKIGRGRAFLMGQDGGGCSVSKEWLTLEGRQFLVEEVPIPQIAQELQTLPASQEASVRFTNSIVNVVSSKRLIPPPPLAQASAKQMEIVTGLPWKSGFVLDYSSPNTTQTNYTFQANVTYYLSGNVSLYGTNTTFEGTAVLKYGSGVSLNINTPVTWTAGPYRPVVMVAMDDNSVGEAVSGSSGNPGTSRYAAKALYFDGTTAGTSLSIENLRILNATAGVVINGSSHHVLNDVQVLFSNTGIAATNTDFTLHNALMGYVVTNFTGFNSTGRVEHLTSASATWLNKDIGANLFLTNCLLAAVTNLGSCTTQYVACPSITNGVFQTVGGATYYLATNSPYRDAGTFTISSNTLAALKHKTTYPPTLFQDVTLSTPTNYAPIVQRDTDLPDLGFHYDPMDYAFSGVHINTNITFLAGTSVGWYTAGSDSYGMIMADRQVVTFNGNFAAPDYFVRCNTVQEGGNNNWTKTWAINGIQSPNNQSFEDVTRAGEVRQQFTFSSVLSWGEQTYHDVSGYLTLRANNSVIVGGNSAGYVISFYVTNSLLDNALVGQSQGHSGNQFVFVNCTFHSGWEFTTRSAPIPVVIRNCAFDGTKIQYAGASDPYLTSNSVTEFSYNAFLVASNRLSPTNVHDLLVSNFNWQTGPLGVVALNNYYLPSNSSLIDAGSATADVLGLYHFTTQTNQVKEASSTVDIGYHYVALDANGSPDDTDGDGVPDYLEDFNGNGQPESWESSWLLGIDTQPQSQNVVQGQNVTFSVVAGGSPPFSYQWRSNGTDIAGANGYSFTKLVVTTNDEAGYSVVVTNYTGSVTSSVAVLTVNSPLSIATNVVPKTVLEGTNVSFVVAVNGNHPVYQWFTNGTAIGGSARIWGTTSNILTISNIVVADALTYTVVISNLFNSVSSAAVLTVIAKPVISSAPTNTTIIQSEDLLLSGSATGQSLYYQWWLTNLFGTTMITNASQPTYSKLVVQTNDAGHYSLVVTNPAGSTNANADLTVLVPPWITQQPASITNNQGANVTLSVSAFGTAGLYYQWYKNGTTALTAATNSTLTLNNIQPTDAAGYTVLVTNVAGTNLSAWAWLSVVQTGGSVTNYGWGSGSPPTPTISNSMIGPTNLSADHPAVYLYGTPISIRASVFSHYSDITNVTFYFTATNFAMNYVLAGTATPGANGKFALAWTNAVHGTNILKAVAWDCDGRTNESPLVYVLMDQAPQISTAPSAINLTWEGITTNVWFTNYISDDGLPYSITNISWGSLAAGVTVADTRTYTPSNIIIATHATLTNWGSYLFPLNVDDAFATNSSSCLISNRHRPVISFNFPTNNSAFLTNIPIVLSATATDLDGTVASVAFYTNSAMLGAGVPSVSNTFTYAWYTAPTWTNVVSAVATDNDSLTSTSAVTTVIFPGLVTRILTPVTSETLLARSNSTISATVTNIMPGTTIQWVEFLVDGQSVGFGAVPSNGVYQTRWIAATGGSHTLTAVATTGTGIHVTSSPVVINVRDVPFVRITSPTNTQVFSFSPTNITVSATVITNGFPIANVTFYDGTNVIGTTNSGSPFTILWTNVLAGTNHLIAKAVDTSGMVGTSSNITVIVEPTNRPPHIDPGLDQTTYLPSNAIPLIGLVTDDGLPFGRKLSIAWTNLNGGTNVTIVNSNLAVATAYFWSTGAYTLRLSVSDSEFLVSSNIIITVLPTNHPPSVYAGADQTLILPAAKGTNPVVTIDIATILEGLHTSGGIDYFSPSNCLITSVNAGDGSPSFLLISTNGVATSFSTISNLYNEVYLTTARTTAGGFKIGEVFCGNGADGQIMRIEPDGTAMGTNVWKDSAMNMQSNAWVMLSRTNEDGSTNQGHLRGGLWLDRTGVWGGDLIAVAYTDDSTGVGHVWRVNSGGKATFLTTLVNGDAYEGVTTIPNDVEKYGPWAGKILIGNDSGASPIYAIDTNGVVTTFNLGIGGEDIRVIPESENFYILNANPYVGQGAISGGSVEGVAASEFAGATGDILVANEAPNVGQPELGGGFLYRVHWNGTNFDIYPLHPQVGPWEGANFAPAGLFDLAPPVIKLAGVVTDDGELQGETSNRWTVLSGTGPVQLDDFTQTNTTVEFTTPGDYVFELSANDGQYVSSNSTTVHILQNHAPIVSAGTNRSIVSSSVTLQGTVSDDSLPYGHTNIYWSVISPGTVSFSPSTNDPAATATFSQPGNYILRLTADDGWSTASAEVTIWVQAPSLTLSPTNSAVGRTNTTYTVSAKLLSTNGSALSGETVHFTISTGPDAGLDVLIPTDGSGVATWTYTNSRTSGGRDTINAYVYNVWGSGLQIFATPVCKDWGVPFDCNTAFLNQGLAILDGQSREFPGHIADYYFIAGTAGKTIELSLVQRSSGNASTVNTASTAVILLRDLTTDQVVAESPVTYVNPSDRTSIKYTCANTGDYLAEVVAVYPGAVGFVNQSYDLSLACSGGPRLGILYHGNVVANGETLVFPPTVYGTPTNILLTITNSGDSALTIAGTATNGNFAFTNNVLGDLLASGGCTNLGIKFNATSNGVSFGALVLAPDSGTNYVVYLMAQTAPTSALPVIHLDFPTNGSTFVNNGAINYSADVVAGSSGVEFVRLLWITTNGVQLVNYKTLSFDGDSHYTNAVDALLWPAEGVAQGDYGITAMVVDYAGQTNMAAPILIHILPPVDPNPTTFANVQVLAYGTNVGNGGTITFPPTLPGQATNLTLIVSNAGEYPLAITNLNLTGDFQPIPDQVQNLVDATLGPGASTDVVLYFNASAHGTAVGSLTCLNNGKNSGTYSVFLVGNAFNAGEGPSSLTNLPPEPVNDEYTVEANSRNNVLNLLANDSDPNGDALRIAAVKTTGTNGGTVAIIDNGREVSYSPPRGYKSEPGFPGDGFYYGVIDGKGGSNWATVRIYIAASDIPNVILSSPPSDHGYATNAGSVVPISATVTNSLNIVKVEFYLGSDKIGEQTNGTGGVYTINWTALYNDSDHTFVAVATDKFGQVGVSSPITINVNPPAGDAHLIAGLDSFTDSSGSTQLTPTNITLIRDGLFNLYGRATNTLGSNVVWQLGVYLADGTLVRDLTPAVTASVGNASTAGVLLTNCDLTTLQNGVYYLRLVVTGGYRISDSTVQIQLESNLKIGQFSFSQQDLVVPLSGIPLTVVRTYNSLNPDKGDFGYSWTYALNDMDVVFDETREDTNDIDGNVFSQRNGGGRDVTLTLPNGQRTTFYFSLEPGESGTYRASWQAAPGITAKLDCQGDNSIQTIVGGLNGNADLFYWQAAGPLTPLDVYDVPGFILTMKDGTTYTVNRDDLGDHFVTDEEEGEGGHYVQSYGAAHLTQIKTLPGDTTTINLDSVEYRSTNGATRKIEFIRNDAGLITAVSDPTAVADPTSPPAVKYEYDGYNNLIAVERLVDRLAGTYVTNSFSYTNAHFPHYITGIFNADGTQVAKNFYDDSGKLTAVQDADGNLTQFFHNATNDMEVIVDRRGNTNTYVYDLRGNVTLQTNQVGQVTSMAYDVLNNKTNEVTFLNHTPYATNSYVYDTNLNVVLVSYDPLGHSNTFAYDGYGRLTNSTDALSHGTTNVYDGSGNLLSTIDALGHTTFNSYSGSLLLGSVDAVGTMTTNAYDGNENLIGTQTIDANHQILSSNSFTFDDNNNRLTSTVWRRVGGTWVGATTANVYDAMNRAVQTINPDGGTNTTVYDADGRQQATVDALGRTTSYLYDSQGRMIQTTYADGTTEESSYDANGNRFSSTDKAGRVTTYIYDALNRVVETIYADNATNATVYDSVGRVAQTIDARGIATGYNYDVAGRRLAVTNAVGKSEQMVSQYAYDSNGNQIIFTDAATHSTTNVFDVVNRQVQTLMADGTTNSTGFDAAGRKVSSTNQDGIVTLFGYDGAGRLMEVTNALGKAEQMVTFYRYDEAGNEIAQIDALGRTNVFTYDDMGRRVLHTRPDAYFEGFTYDLLGNLAGRTNFNGTTLTNQYDVMNRLIVKGQIGVGAFETYAYTATGQRVFGNSYSVITNGYLYDSRDRVRRKFWTWNGGIFGTVPANLTVALTYDYDPSGNLTNVSSSMANGVQVTYQYDALNRVTNVLSHGQLAASYTFDQVGNLQGMKYGNGVTNQYQYDSLNRLTNLIWMTNGNVAASFYYQLGKTGNRTNLTEIVNSVNHSYAWMYDNLYRMTNENIGGAGGGAMGYQFDPVGNRTNRAVIGSLTGVMAAQAPTYDTNDWLTADSYDLNGNTTTSDSVSYNYDVQNRMINSSTILYDVDGNRIAKQTNSVAIYYLVDDHNPTGYPQVLEEYRVLPGSYIPATLTRVYDYGMALISQQQFNTNTLLPSVTSYYGFDGHGSVRFLTSTNQSLSDTYMYDGYGTLVNSTGSTPNSYLYCGEQYDADLGLYYLRARYYKTDTGRFWTSDSYEGEDEEPSSLHKYAYTQANPVNKLDSNGHESYVGFDTVGWNNYGHVGIITHNPYTHIYAEFDHAHGIVSQRRSADLNKLLRTSDGYGIVFIIPSQYDLALDTARDNYKKHPGGSTMENNCLTSVLEIFDTAKVPYPDNHPWFPNMWLTAFWDANYGYKLLRPKAAAWIIRVDIKKDSLGLGMVPGTGALYVTF